MLLLLKHVAYLTRIACGVNVSQANNSGIHLTNTFRATRIELKTSCRAQAHHSAALRDLWSVSRMRQNKRSLLSSNAQNISEGMLLMDKKRFEPISVCVYIYPIWRKRVVKCDSSEYSRLQQYQQRLPQSRRLLGGVNFVLRISYPNSRIGVTH